MLSISRNSLPNPVNQLLVELIPTSTASCSRSCPRRLTVCLQLAQRTQTLACKVRQKHCGGSRTGSLQTQKQVHHHLAHLTGKGTHRGIQHGLKILPATAIHHRRPAGPQPRAPEQSVPRRTSTTKKFRRYTR